MKTQRSAFYIKSKGADESSIKKGLRWLHQLGSKDLSKRSATLAVNQPSILRGTIESVIGSAAVKKLRDRHSITVTPTQVSLLTERDSIYSLNGPVLAVYPSKKLLDKIDSLEGVTDILVIPWTQSEIQYWIDTWSAAELGSTSQPTASKQVSDPVVKAALESLTHRVNLSSALANPTDRSATIRTFEVLRDNGVSYDPPEIRSWLVSQLHWNPKDADKAEELAEGVLRGTSYKVERDVWIDNIFEIWKNDAKNY